MAFVFWWELVIIFARKKLIMPSPAASQKVWTSAKTELLMNGECYSDSEGMTPNPKSASALPKN
jgi:hypothetical protein